MNDLKFRLDLAMLSGKRDGIEENRVNTVKNLINLNANDDFIKKSVEIDQEQLDKIKKLLRTKTS